MIEDEELNGERLPDGQLKDAARQIRGPKPEPEKRGWRNLFHR
jgi:hypothetical protein